MPAPAADVLLYLHNNPPRQHASVIEPIANALRAHWDGEVVVAEMTDVHVWLGPNARVLVGDRELVPARTFARVFSTSYGTTLSRGLAALGSRVVNAPAAVALAHSKFEGAAALHAAGLPVPEQVLFPGNPNEGMLAVQDALGWPRIVKADRGMGGDAVWLTASPDEISERAIDSYLIQPWVAQQFRDDADGTDVRIVVAAGEIVGAMERRAAPGDFRANLKQGGSAHPTEISDREADIALRATAAMGLTIAGVDLLRTNDGPMLTEVNPNPALSGIASVLGGNVVYNTVAAAVVSG